MSAIYASGLDEFGRRGLANRADPALAALHETRSGDIHDRHRDLTIRARLQRAYGRSDNQIIWIGPGRERGQAAQTAQTGGVNLAALSLDTMNKWLDDIAADPAPLSTDKVVRHKPAEAVDACWDAEGKKIVEKASFDGKGKCNTLYPVNSEPRMVAGAPLTNDIIKCQLKPINFADYKVSFTDAQKARMKAIFPAGVCDYSKPGVGQGPIKGTYQRY